MVELKNKSIYVNCLLIKISELVRLAISLQSAIITTLNNLCTSFICDKHTIQGKWEFYSGGTKTITEIHHILDLIEH